MKKKKNLILLIKKKIKIILLMWKKTNLILLIKVKKIIKNQILGRDLVTAK